MAYKYPTLPTAGAYKEEIADFWELQAIQNPSLPISNIKINKILSIGEDEVNNDGIESVEDIIDNELDDVFQEFKRRETFTSSKYPFEIGKFSIKFNEKDSLESTIYLYLLLCTRFNMRDQKKFNDIDATLLFEELCAYILQKYFGEKSKSFVFGTATGGSFKDKVKDFIDKVAEGDDFSNPDPNPPTAKDYAIDVVAYLDFADKRPGKLIALGQCKTGTSWKDEIRKLRVNDFCDLWLKKKPIATPLPLVFVCDTLHEDLNLYQTQFGYIFFNRFRIMEYINEDIPKDLLDKIKSWLAGAKEELNIKR